MLAPCAVLLLMPPLPDLSGQSDPATALDFWVGTWSIDSTTPQPEGKPPVVQKDYGTNTITKTLKNKVIHENFRGTGFTGESWSVFLPQTQKWRQTWVDDSGGYLTFEGGMDGKEFVLNQLFPAPNMRMRFTEITKVSFVWLWETKNPDGSFSLKWRLDYRRKGETGINADPAAELS